MGMSFKVPFVAVCLAASAGLIAAPAPDAGGIAAVLTSPRARAQYLAHAVIWSDPGPLSPDELLAGVPGLLPYPPDRLTGSDPIACSFTTPGRLLGGKSPKFICVGDDRVPLRLKYWDAGSQRGNREVFATVAATRLLLALGFMTMPAVALDVQCRDCPDDPMTGTGRRGPHHYIAMWQSPLPSPRILSETDIDQGWSWRELDEAIRSLPAGEERNRQRAQFDALALAGVLLQHGDRKPEQQALYCSGDVDMSAGEVRSEGGRIGTMLVERENAAACARAVVAIVDAGATFGGAGRTSNSTTAKMNLEHWRRKPVFEPGGNECRGELTVSLAAGKGGEGSPVVSEQGRMFLLQQLHRLTPAHVRAMFTAAQVARLRGGQQGDPQSLDSGAVDAWTAAFEEKVREIEERRCTPES
jgi:hypothetical protein